MPGLWKKAQMISGDEAISRYLGTFSKVDKAIETELERQIVTEQLKVFVGYDKREPAAYDVCTRSIAARSTIPLQIIKLDIDQLREAGTFTRQEYTQGNQRYDVADGKPFSTDFAFTRFLVPHLCGYRGLAVFLDCDFLVLEDIAELLKLQDDKYAVQVVKHKFEPPDGRKMDNQVQQAYPCKNWSSFILWNCGHPANKILTPEVVNIQRGGWLHAFKWLENEQIGSLPETWNWLVGHTRPKAIHFTSGSPFMPGYEDCEYSRDWHREYWRGRA